jgi:hypothetical protein
MADADALHIGENSPEQVAFKLLYEIANVEGSHVVSVMLPLSAALPSQQTRLPFLRFFDSATVMLVPPYAALPGSSTIEKAPECA